MAFAFDFALGAAFGFGVGAFLAGASIAGTALGLLDGVASCSDFLTDTALASSLP